MGVFVERTARKSVTDTGITSKHLPFPDQNLTEVLLARIVLFHSITSYTTLFSKHFLSHFQSTGTRQIIGSLFTFWNKGKIIPLKQKRLIKQCEDYRGVSKQWRSWTSAPDINRLHAMGQQSHAYQISLKYWNQISKGMISKNSEMLWYEQLYSLSSHQAWPCLTGQSKQWLGQGRHRQQLHLHSWKRVRAPIAERTKLLMLPAKEDPR